MGAMQLLPAEAHLPAWLTASSGLDCTTHNGLCRDDLWLWLDGGTCQDHSGGADVAARGATRRCEPLRGASSRCEPLPPELGPRMTSAPPGMVRLSGERRREGGGERSGRKRGEVRPRQSVSSHPHDDALIGRRDRDLPRPRSSETAIFRDRDLPRPSRTGVAIKVADRAHHSSPAPGMVPQPHVYREIDVWSCLLPSAVPCRRNVIRNDTV